MSPTRSIRPGPVQLSLPAGCVTGVGSLPFEDPGDAISFVARHCPVLPFWPQLPCRLAQEGIISQGLGALAALLQPGPRPYCWQLLSGAQHAFAAGLDQAEACLIPATAAGFFALEDALEAERFPQAVAIKAQTEGPATLTGCLFLDGEPLSSQSGWLEMIASFVARQAAWQVMRLRRFGKPVVFVMDEPAISLWLACPGQRIPCRLTEAIEVVLRAAREAGAIVGIHCCSALPVQLLAALEPDFVSFDAHLPVAGQGWRRLVQAIMARSGRLAFGLVPTDLRSPTWVSDLFVRWLNLVSGVGDVVEIASRTIVTATCGLGLVTPTDAETIFGRCRQVGRTIQRVAQSVPVG